MDKPVGKITHYYDKIGVAVVELADTIKVGNQIRIKAPESSTRETDFTQIVNSIQVEHKQVEIAKKGEAVGMKVDQPVKDGDQVYLEKV